MRINRLKRNDGVVILSNQGAWKSRGLRLARLLSVFLTVFLVSKFIIDIARDSIDGLTYGWVITAISMGFVLGIIAYATIGLVFETRQRVLAIMALNNLKRRKRNTALVIVGLLVGSAIITSSLVVGDSLDATLQAEYAESLDENDIVISGTDELGMPVWWNQTRAEMLIDNLYLDSDIDAVSLGITMPVGLKSEVHRTVEARSASLLAMDEQYQQQGSWNPFDGGLQYSDINNGSAFVSQKGADKMKLVIETSEKLHYYSVAPLGISIDGFENYPAMKLSRYLSYVILNF